MIKLRLALQAFFCYNKNIENIVDAINKEINYENFKKSSW